MKTTAIWSPANGFGMLIEAISMGRNLASWV
jgi:hypothetical protein